MLYKTTILITILLYTFSVSSSPLWGDKRGATNPNNGIFTFESNDELSYELEVYNMLGEKMLKQSVSNKQEVNMQNMPSSTYIIRVVRNNEVIKTTRICIIK